MPTGLMTALQRDVLIASSVASAADVDNPRNPPFISSRSLDLHDDFAAAARCPPEFVGSRGVFKGEHFRHLDA